MFLRGIKWECNQHMWLVHRDCKDKIPLYFCISWHNLVSHSPWNRPRLQWYQNKKWQTWNMRKQSISHALSGTVRKPLLPPANEVYEGYVFTGVCLGHAWLPGGSCMVAGGHVWQRGACMVKGACMTKGGMHGEGGMHCKGGAWWRGGVCGKGGCMGYNEIWSMSGWYASYWNAFLFLFFMRICQSILYFDRL